jgi:hypothetical protein
MLARTFLLQTSEFKSQFTPANVFKIHRTGINVCCLPSSKTARIRLYVGAMARRPTPHFQSPNQTDYVFKHSRYTIHVLPPFFQKHTPGIRCWRGSFGAQPLIFQSRKPPENVSKSQLPVRICLSSLLFKKSTDSWHVGAWAHLQKTPSKSNTFTPHVPKSYFTRVMSRSSVYKSPRHPNMLDQDLTLLHFPASETLMYQFMSLCSLPPVFQTHSRNTHVSSLRYHPENQMRPST